MNKKLEISARAILLENLLKCNEKQQMMFKRMYSHKNIDNPIEQAVADMDADKINWAMEQVEATIKKNIAGINVL